MGIGLHDLPTPYYSDSLYPSIFPGWLALQNKNKVQATFVLYLDLASSALTEVVEQAFIFSCVT